MHLGGGKKGIMCYYLSMSRHHHSSDHVHHHHWRFSLHATGVLCQSRRHLLVGELPLCLPVRHWVRCCQLFHHSGGDEEAETGKGCSMSECLLESELKNYPIRVSNSLFWPLPDSKLLQRHRGHGVRWLLPRHWYRPDILSRGRQHPKHRAEHSGPKFNGVSAYRRHTTAQEAPVKATRQLHNEQQLHDRLLFPDYISTGLPALQHYLLEFVCMKHEVCCSSTTKPASNLLTGSGTLHSSLRGKSSILLKDCQFSVCHSLVLREK